MINVICAKYDEQTNYDKAIAILDAIASGDNDAQLLVQWWQLPSREAMAALYAHKAKRLRQHTITGVDLRDRPLTPSIRFSKKEKTIAYVTARLTK